MLAVWSALLVMTVALPSLMAVLTKVGRSSDVLVLGAAVVNGDAEGVEVVDWERGTGRTLTVEDCGK